MLHEMGSNLSASSGGAGLELIKRGRASEAISPAVRLLLAVDLA
jgi:hypothetical protein